ncbi:unnamed protein product [Brassica oleracea]
MHISAVYFLYLEMDSKVRLMCFDSKNVALVSAGKYIPFKRKIIFILVTDQLAAVIVFQKILFSDVTSCLYIK